MSQHRGGPEAEAGPLLSTDDFRALRRLIRDHCGVHIPEENAYLLERRLRRRLAALELPGYAAYREYLSSPSLPPAALAAELDQVFEVIATHETYFFREGYQLTAFQKEILPEVHQRRAQGRRLAVWSAGCSTGEEAYTIAILIRESRLFHDWDVRVVGSDLSGAALETARAGRYGPSSFRQTGEDLAGRYFRPGADGRSDVAAEVRGMVSFARHNLHRPGPPLPHAPFDVIFCRNVIIYLDRQVRPALLQRFADHLVPGGYLLLGHSENLLDMDAPFSTCHLKREIVYRKP